MSELLSMAEAMAEIKRLNNLLECVREYDRADENASFDGEDHPIVKLAKENDTYKAEIERLTFALESVLRRTKFDASVGIIRNYVSEVLGASDE